MMNRIFQSIFIVALFFLSACQHKAVKEVPLVLKKMPIKAKAKVQLRDLRKGDVHYLDVDILSQQDQRLRMDLRATLGILVASISILDNEVSYLIPQRKTYYSGLASDRSFKPLGSLQLHPKAFYSLIFDKPIRFGDWRCLVDPKGLPVKCESTTLKSKVEWLERNSSGLKVLVSSLNFEMTWILKSVEEMDSAQDKDFKLAAPENFTRVSI